MYSDAVLSFPPVVTSILSDPRRARFGPRLFSSKIFLQIRSPPPNKHQRKEELSPQSKIFLVFSYSIRMQPVLFNTGNYIVKRRVIKTFSGYSEDTTIVSLVLSLLKEKLSSIYICRNLDEGSDQVVDRI